MEKSTEMGREGSDEELCCPMFNETIRRAQKAFISGNWREFKSVFEQDTKSLVENYDLFNSPPLYIATRSKNPILLKDLLEMLPQDDTWNALTRKNREDNTLLHEIALLDGGATAMVDVVFEFLKKAAPPPPSPEDHKGLKKILLEMKNKDGETPVFRAAKYGKLDMFKKMVELVHEIGSDISVHLHSETQTILHACVSGEFFDVAIWIMMKMDGKTLAAKKNEKELTCLQLLSRMPRAFRSHYNMGYCESLLYNLLPEAEYGMPSGVDNSELSPQKTDLETGQQHDAMSYTKDVSRINQALWKYLAKVLTGIDELWKKKRKQESAKRVAELLVKYDYSWQKSDDNTLRKTSIVLPPVLYNVQERKKILELKKQKKQKKKEKKEEDEEEDEDEDEEEKESGTGKDKYYSLTPLMVAASYGIVEIVEIFLEEHPQAIHHTIKGGQNILHIAVKHRQLKIFKLLKKSPEFDALASQISYNNNRTILHQVARTDFYRAPELAGAAFQLQAELKWYKRVEKVIRRHLIMHCDSEYLTAGDVLDISHDDMLRDAQSWIKETAQSCSTVSVLIATVVFAAAYAIPGGTEGGEPVHLGSPVFLFFTTMDVVALALSLASVVMFLSILTSPFELWDFYRSLPTRLNLGFAFMFCSLTTTMLAFIATILLTIRVQWKHWTSTLIYGAAFFPVTIFAFIEFPLYMRLPSLLTKMCKKLIKMVSIDKLITRCCFTKRIQKTKYP